MASADMSIADPLSGQVRRFIRLYGTPAVVEAVQFTGGNYETVYEWVRGHGPGNVVFTELDFRVPCMMVGLDGMHREVLQVGSWLLRDETGRYSAWYPSSFDKSFVPMKGQGDL